MEVPEVAKPTIIPKVEILYAVRIRSRRTLMNKSLSTLCRIPLLRAQNVVIADDMGVYSGKFSLRFCFQTVF